MSLTRQEFKKLRADLLAEIIVEISGLKTNQLPGVAAISDHLFFVADKTTGLAYKATEQQVREAIGANSFNSCVPTTMPTNMKDGDVYWPESVGTYTNFKDATNTAIVVTTNDAVVYFIYSTNHFVKKGNTVSLVDYVAKSTLQNNFNTVTPLTTALDAAMGKTIKSVIDGRTLYGSYVLQTLTQETGAVNANTGVLDSTVVSWTRCINIPVVPGQKIKFTAVNTDLFGFAGYDAAGVFLSALDSYGLPYGTLWNNIRYAALNGTTAVVGRVLYTDVEIVIPANCYIVKACSATSSTAPISPLIVSLEVFGTGSITTKDKIATNSTDISNLKKSDSPNTYQVFTDYTLSNGRVTASDGTTDTSTTGWKKTSMIAVVPGQKIRLTCACSSGYGAAAYDKNGVHLSTLDSYGLKVGNLWSKTRWTAMTGLTQPDSNTFFIVEVVAPANCYGIRVSSNLSGAPQTWAAIVVEFEVIDTTKTIKQQVAVNSADIDNIKKQLLVLTDVTGTTIQPELVSTIDGTLITPTSSNIWEHSDFITVREQSEIGKDIYVSFTGVITNTRSDSGNSATTGLAGYDAAGVFLSTLDVFGIPEGTLWDYDRFVQNNYKPTRTKFTTYTHCFTDVLIKIPANCFKIRGQGTVINASVGGFPLILKKGVYNSEAPVSVSGGGGASVDSVYIDRVASNVIAWGLTAADTNIKRFTFIHFSDIHYHSLNYDINHKEINSFVNDSIASFRIDAILCTGDISDGIAARGKAATLAETTDFATEFLKSQKPVMYLPGNHDDNVNFDGAGLLTKTSVMNNAISKTELYNIFNGAIKTKYGLLQTVTNKLYSYQDFADYGIRVIAIDRYECPVISDGGANNMIRYKNANEAGHYYSQAQLDWLQTTLASVPAGWAVLVMTHGNFINNVSDFAILTCLQGWSLIPAIIDAWKKGAMYSHTFTHPVFADMNTSKTFDFRTRGTGEFITYIGGHTHCPYYGFLPAFPDQRTMAVACTFTGGMSKSTANTWGITRSSDSIELRNSFHVISVDRANKKLYITFFGAHKDLEGNTTTDSIIIPY